MHPQRKVELILETLNHQNGKDMKINTLWVGQQATAEICFMLGGSYGKFDIEGKLKEILEAPTQGGLQQIDKVFYYLMHYMVNMDVIK